jgi:N-acetylneuraminate synthase
VSAVRIAGRGLGPTDPTFFIADVASNHDGDLGRAKHLIELSKEAGADAVKFQHFLAKDIVSDYGFSQLAGQLSHQAGWKKSVYEVYEQYELNRDWNAELVETAREVGITFMTTPYDRAAVEAMAPHVPAFKVGSGDITWIDFLELIASQGKPVLLATGASTMDDTVRAVEAILRHTDELVVMQCNTNYTGDPENFQHVNLNVLRTFAARWPDLPLGLSDHTPGHAAVLGAIALGARVVEKHFTDDNDREGPDHAFSLNPVRWREMVDRSRELEAALGDGVKRVEPNEADTIVVQRRSLRLTRDKSAGETIDPTDIEALRPAPEGALPPYRAAEAVGRRLAVAKPAGASIEPGDLE